MHKSCRMSLFSGFKTFRKIHGTCFLLEPLNDCGTKNQARLHTIYCNQEITFPSLCFAESKEQQKINPRRKAVRMLEEQAADQTMESVVVVKKSQIIVDDDEGSADGDSGNSDEVGLPEIESRVCGKNILLKIQCEKRKGLLGKILGEVEKLNLAVVNIGVAPFGSLALDITIIAKMEKELSLSTKDIVTALRSAFESTA
ncbi:hypothetical protein Pfo_008533 [Paulownia fortunei]|nr:hypothetical protein Pfo_008533 [Paulownia fortunei]